MIFFGNLSPVLVGDEKNPGEGGTVFHPYRTYHFFTFGSPTYLPFLLIQLLICLISMIVKPQVDFVCFLNNYEH